MKKKAYAAAGVDVDLGNEVKKGIQAMVQSTHGPEVLGRIGGFGGLFQPDFRGLRQPVLVSSVDGVGTKLKIAFATDRHHTIGQDLVNHCINDIAVIGARPLFFLDYLAAGKLEPRVFREILRGFAKACREGGCALVGGETAQMPGMYQAGEYDVAGCIVGVVERRKLLDGSKIRPGDLVVGLSSNGLHTNGYSLARKVLLEQAGFSLSDKLPGLRGTLADELLKVHRNYQPLLAALPEGLLRGAVHVTGGGLVDNFPRILPADCAVEIDTGSWQPSAIFRLIQSEGKIAREEMYQVFNMGIGLALVVPEKKAAELSRSVRGRIIGKVVSGERNVHLL